MHVFFWQKVSKTSITHGTALQHFARRKPMVSLSLAVLLCISYKALASLLL
jgi:hypothetical protein